MSTPLVDFRRRRTAQSISSTLSDKPPPPTSHPKPATLAKRLLFPNLPPDADLPPLLLSRNVPPELNQELYDFIAIALRAYINPWWTKITRYDKEFLPAVTRVLTVVIRTFESRLAGTDLSPLLLCDLPTLLSQHVQDYRSARFKLHSSYAAGGAATVPQLFHQMQPHMALSADGRVDEAYLRQAVDELLRLCLPVEDYDPETERYIVREIVLKVLQEGVIPRVSQPWFIQQSLLTLLGPDQSAKAQVSSRIAVNPSPERPPLPRRSSGGFSLQSLAIFFFSTVQSISGACLVLIHAYKHALGTIRKVNQPILSHSHQSSTTGSPLPAETIPGGLIQPPALPPIVTQSATPPSPPPSPRSSKGPEPSSTLNIPTAAHIPPHTLASASPAALPDYVSPFLHLVHTLLSFSPRSMPYALLHVLNLLLLPFSVHISRLLPHLVYSHTLSPDNLVYMVRSAKGALFPGGWPAVAPPDPTPEEQVELQQEANRRLLGLIPSPLRRLLGSTSAAQTRAMDEVLEPFSSQECNTHLIVFILDLVLLTLFPELGVSDSVGDGGQSEALGTPPGSFKSIQSSVGDLTPPRSETRTL